MFMYSFYYQEHQIIPSWIKAEKYWNCDDFVSIIKNFCIPF